MDFDLVLRDVQLADAKPGQPATDIGVKDGRIAAIAPRLGGGAKEQVQGGGRVGHDRGRSAEEENVHASEGTGAVVNVSDT